MEGDDREIRNIHSTWVDAVNSGNLERLLALMTSDAVFLGPGQVPLGREQFSAGFAAAHQSASINCVSAMEDIAIVGDVAYTLSWDSLSVAPRVAGEPTHLAGHRLTVYRRQADGRWLLARDAHTLSPVLRSQA